MKKIIANRYIQQSKNFFLVLSIESLRHLKFKILAAKLQSTLRITKNFWSSPFIKYSITFFSLFIFAGCASSIIKVNAVRDENPYTMFGKNGTRDFYIAEEIGDSLKLKWESEINGSFQNSSVTVYDKFVFINDLSGRVFCIDIETGKTAGQLKHKGAVYTTPVINKFNLIYAVAYNDESKSLLSYYDYTDGKALHEKEIEGRVLNEIIKLEDGIIFNTEKGKVYKYNFIGEKIWETDTGTFTHSSPALSDRDSIGIIIFGNDDGEIIGIKSDNGKLSFRKKIGKSFFGGTSISNGTAFIGSDDGNLYSIDINSGEVIWSFNTGARIIMTPAVYEENIIVGNLAGNLFSLNKNNGRINWETKINGVLNAAPLVTKNLVLIPNLYESYHLLNVENGEIIETLNLEGRAKLTPVFFKDLLFIGYDSGIIRAYEIYN